MIYSQQRHKTIYNTKKIGSSNRAIARSIFCARKIARKIFFCADELRGLRAQNFLRIKKTRILRVFAHCAARIAHFCAIARFSKKYHKIIFFMGELGIKVCHFLRAHCARTAQGCAKIYHP